MTHVNRVNPGVNVSKPFGKTIIYLMFLLFFSLLAPADIFKKIHELGLECREGNEEECAELSDMARRAEDGNVRLAAACYIKDKSIGESPGPIDPNMQPVLVELARENVRQFLEKLSVLIQEDEKLQLVGNE